MGRGLAFTAVKVPEITIIRHPVADGLGAVKDTAAAYGKHHIKFLPAAEIYAFIYKLGSGVWLYSAKTGVVDAGAVKRFLNSVYKSRAYSAAAAEVDEDSGAAVFFTHLSGLVLNIMPEKKIRGSAETEIKHLTTALLILP